MNLLVPNAGVSCPAFAISLKDWPMSPTAASFNLDASPGALNMIGLLRPRSWRTTHGHSIGQGQWIKWTLVHILFACQYCLMLCNPQYILEVVPQFPKVYKKLQPCIKHAEYSTVAIWMNKSISNLSGNRCLWSRYLISNLIFVKLSRHQVCQHRAVESTRVKESFLVSQR